MLLGFTLVATSVGTAALSRNVERAFVDSLKADLGSRAFVLQTGEADVAARLKALPVAVPVQDDPGNLRTSTEALPVLVRTTTSDSASLGALITGRRPVLPGEANITLALADALNISAGQQATVQVDEAVQDVTVVGFIVDPSNAASASVIRVITPGPTFQPTRWLSDRDFYDDEAVARFLDQRKATYQSVESLMESASINRPPYVSALRSLPLAFGGLFGLMLLSAVLLFARKRWVTYVEALVATGMARRAAWRYVLHIVARVVFAGQIFGASAVLAALILFDRGISSWFNQAWVSLAWPWLPLLLVLVIPVLVLAVFPSALQWANLAAPRITRLGRAVPASRWAPPLVVLAGAAWLTLLLTTSTDAVSSLGVYISALLLVAMTPFALPRIVALRLPPTLKAVTRNLASGLAPAVSLAAVLSMATGAWAATTTSDAYAGEALSSPLEPAGSFLISEVPDTAVDTLSELYAGNGGTDMRTYGLPDESSGYLRVTSPVVIECLGEQGNTDVSTLPEACFTGAGPVSVNIVAIDPSADVAKADPRLIVDGEVGILHFTDASFSATDVLQAPAEPDVALGGNVPGLVLPPDSPLLQRFAQESGGSSTVLLLDFGDLAVDQQLETRAAVYRLFPAAQTADGTDPTSYDRLRSAADGVAIVGAVSASVLLLLGATAYVQAHAMMRSMLSVLSGRGRSRTSILARIAALPILSILFTVTVTILTATLFGSQQGSSIGLSWAMPGLFTLLSGLGIAVLIFQVPARNLD